MIDAALAIAVLLIAAWVPPWASDFAVPASIARLEM